MLWQPSLNERYTKADPDVAGARHRRPPASPGRQARHPRAPLPVRRGDQARRPHGRQPQAQPARRARLRREAGRASDLLRRALHGRVRRHAHPRARQRHAARSLRRLLDGRHGAARRLPSSPGNRSTRRLDRQGFTGPGDPDHLRQLVRRHQGLRRRARRRLLHQLQRRHRLRVGRPRPATGTRGATTSRSSSCPISTSDATPRTSSGSTCSDSTPFLRTTPSSPNQGEPLGGMTPRSAPPDAKVILWAGHCSVHKLFRPEHVDEIRELSRHNAALERGQAALECDRAPRVLQGGRGQGRPLGLDRVHPEDDRWRPSPAPAGPWAPSTTSSTA